MKNAINAKQLKRALLATLDAASTDLARPALTMPQIEFGMDQLIITASDGIILSTTTLDAPGLTGPKPTSKTPNPKDFFYAAMYTAATIKAIIAAIPTHAATCEIYAQTESLTIDGKMYKKAEEQPKFLDYRQISDSWKQRKSNTATADPADIIPAVTAIAKMSKTWTIKKGKEITYQPVTRLYINPASITLIMQSEEIGSARRDLPAKSANNFICAINAAYMERIIKHATGQQVKFIYSKPNAPIDIFYGPTHAVIMPMPIDNAASEPTTPPEIIIPQAAPSNKFTAYKCTETSSNRVDAFPYPITSDIFCSTPTPDAREFIIDDIRAEIITLDAPSDADKYQPAGHEHDRAQITMTCQISKINTTPAATAPQAQPQNDEKTPILAPQATQPEPITAHVPKERNLPTQPAPDQAPDQAPQPDRTLDTYAMERAAILKKYRWVDRTDPKYKSTIHNGRINLRNELAALDARRAAINVTAEFSTIPARVTA